MNKEESLEKYKQHLRDNVTYMGVGSMVLELLDNNKVANFAISSLAQEVYGLQEQNKKLVEALRFYASRENWFPVPNIQGLELIVDHSDEELIKLGENESVYSGGKLARAVLKEVEKEASKENL